MSTSDFEKIGLQKISVVATFELNQNSEIEFYKLAIAHSENTIVQCAGCLRYDVVRVTCNLFLFYEVYATEEYFEEHKRSEYLKIFRERRAPFVLNHTILMGDLVNGG